MKSKKRVRIGKWTWLAALSAVVLWQQPTLKAQTPVFTSAVSFGGAGDQRGTAIVRNSSDLYLVGDDTSASSAIAIRVVAGTSTPTWSTVLTGGSPPYVSFSGAAFAIDTLFMPGRAYPPACCATDGGGDTEPKPIMARIPVAGVPAPPA